MNFWEAMKIVDEGGKVTRPCFQVGYITEVTDGEVSFIDWKYPEGSQTYRPFQSDMTANDWIEVDSESSAGQEAWDDLMDEVDTYLGEDDE